MNYFPNNDEEISLIRFISTYQYLNVHDTKYFFDSQKYYRKRVTNLIKKRYLKRIKFSLVLDELGFEYTRLFNFEYNPLNRNQKYVPRLLCISNLGAFFHKSDTVNLIPSFSMKDKDMLTIKARRFIGVLEINGFDYLTYYISKDHDKRYLNSVIYDIQKEKKYQNIVILINDITRINTNEFSFGMNQVLIIEDNTVNRNKLQYLHSLNKTKIIEDSYKTPLFLSEYNFCDYTDYKNKYVSIFYFFDTEKVTRIKHFLRENKNKNADIICSIELANELKQELPNSHYIMINLEDYIDKERNIYD